MQRVKRSTAVAVLPAAPAGGTPGYFANPNPGGGVPATVPGYEWFNSVQEEICAIIAAAGIALDVNNPAQLLAALRSAGVFQTAAQNDDSTKAATTGFVRRAGVQMANVNAITGNTTLTAANANQFFQLNPSAAGVTVTLPLANTCPNGTIALFQNTSNYPVTIAKQGADAIFTSLNLSSIVVTPGDSVMLVTNSAGLWLLFGGSTQLANSPSAGVFGASLSANGYKKGPAGEIDQWVYAATGTSVAGSMMVTLPVAFPAAILSTVACSANGANPATAVGVGGASTLTQVQVYFAANTSGVFVRAIGK
ncbi:hypothetical protein ABWL39_20720 [Chitinivorax sp. PXF-14]|uniref:gp53-like domain-containing protein n=1 Tax=Chitinivorax sp. PXF-14 TaxID=3230488 RepID=UPI0034670F6F